MKKSKHFSYRDNIDCMSDALLGMFIGRYEDDFSLISKEFKKKNKRVILDVLEATYAKVLRDI